MGLASGLASQLMCIAEATYGTRLAPTRTFEYTGETLKFHVDPIESKGARAGRTFQHRRTVGKQWVDGPLNFELGPIGFGIILKHCIGKDVTTGAGPFVHTYTHDFSIDTLSQTIQIGVPQFDGTMDVFDYSGCQFTSWEITQEVGANCMLQVQVYGSVEVTNQTLATAAYPAGLAPFTWDQCVLQLAGVTTPWKKLTISGDNGMATGLHRGSSTNGKSPRQSRSQSRVKYGGTVDLDFENLTNYAKYIARTDTAFSAVWTSGANSLAITGNIHFEGDTPNVSDPEQLVDLPLPYVFYSPTNDATAFTAVLTNTDTLS